MTRIHSHLPNLVLILIPVMISVMAPNSAAQKMFPLPVHLVTVNHAVSAENLRAVASKSNDPQVLLGLAFLAQAGDSVRTELSGRAIRARPEYAPIAAVLALMMDGVEEKSVRELLQRDPDNALGHYLLGNLLYQTGKETDALAAFRKASTCAELRLYESVTGEALFKAIDALGLKGRDRLYALSWMVARVGNFGSMAIQNIARSMGELVRPGDTSRRKEISDQLIVLAGHLFATNFDNLFYAQRALELAFRLKAEAGAAEKSPTMNGYAAVVQALVSTHLSWPGIKDRRAGEEPLELAQFVPARIYRAFSLVDPAQRDSLFELRVNVPEANQAGFAAARETAIKTGQALIDLALADPDGIIGPYLKGRPARRYEDGPWVSYWSPVEKLMSDRPEIFRAATEHEEAMARLVEAGKTDPRRLNIRRMMEISLGILSYANEHGKAYPANLSVLFEQGYLKAPLEANSMLTGKPYHYVAAGEKQPEKGADWNQLILLYDESVVEGAYPCAMADGSGGMLRVGLVKEQLKRRGK